MKTYLVWGEYGPVASAVVEEIVEAKSRISARAKFIKNMKKSYSALWEMMGEQNVYAREYVVEKDRKEVVEVLTRSVDLDGRGLSDIISDMGDYESMIADKYGIAGSGFIDYESYGYDGGFEMAIKYKRLETDAEYDRRQTAEVKLLKKKEAAERKQDEKDRKEFERLKKKFGEKA